MMNCSRFKGLQNLEARGDCKGALSEYANDVQLFPLMKWKFKEGWLIMRISNIEHGAKSCSYTGDINCCR